MYDLDYDLFSQKIKEDIRRWNLIPVLGFESRIESVKMNILPRVLYLFQTVSVEITDRQFNEWDKLLSRYIWQGKKNKAKISTSTDEKQRRTCTPLPERILYISPTEHFV